MENTIKSILYTLDKIEIHGKKNIDSMLGCMQALERLLEQVVSHQNATNPVQQEID